MLLASVAGPAVGAFLALVLDFLGVALVVLCSSILISERGVGGAAGGWCDVSGCHVSSFWMTDYFGGLLDCTVITVDLIGFESLSCRISFYCILCLGHILLAVVRSWVLKAFNRCVAQMWGDFDDGGV